MTDEPAPGLLTPTCEELDAEHIGYVLVSVMPETVMPVAAGPDRDAVEAARDRVLDMLGDNVEWDTRIIEVPYVPEGGVDG